MSLDSDEFQESTSEGFLGQKFQVPDFGVFRKPQSSPEPLENDMFIWSIEEIQQQSKHFFNMQQCRFRKYGSTKCNG